MANLYQLYQNAGKTLPTVGERSGLAKLAGISNYSGSVDQNTALADYITKNKVDLTKPWDVSQGSSSLTSGEIPTPAKNTTDYNAVTDAAALTAPKSDSVTGTSIEEILKNINAKTKTLQDRNTEAANLLASSDVSANQTKLNDINNQLAQINAQAQADQLSLTGQGRGITTAIIGGQQSQIEKERAIKALTLSATASALQGQVDSAKAKIENALNLKYGDASTELDNYVKFANTMMPYLSAEQQAKVEAQTEAKKEAADAASKLSDLKKTLATKAIDAGQGSLAAKIVNGKDENEVWQLATSLTPSTSLTSDAQLKLKGLYDKEEPVAQFATVMPAYSRMNSLIGNRSTANYAEIAKDDSKVYGIVSMYARMLRPDISRAADSGDVVASDTLADNVNQLYARIVKGQNVDPSKLQQYVSSADNLYKSALDLKGTVDKEYVSSYGYIPTNTSLAVEASPTSIASNVSNDELAAQLSGNSNIASTPNTTANASNVGNTKVGSSWGWFDGLKNLFK